jgi:hypothetical protein
MHSSLWVSHQPVPIQSSDRVPAIVQRLPDFSLLANLSNLLSLIKVGHEILPLNQSGGQPGQPGQPFWPRVRARVGARARALTKKQLWRFEVGQVGQVGRVEQLQWVMLGQPSSI